MYRLMQSIHAILMLRQTCQQCRPDTFQHTYYINIVFHNFDTTISVLIVTFTCFCEVYRVSKNQVCIIIIPNNYNSHHAYAPAPGHNRIVWPPNNLKLNQILSNKFYLSSGLNVSDELKQCMVQARSDQTRYICKTTAVL